MGAATTKNCYRRQSGKARESTPLAKMAQGDGLTLSTPKVRKMNGQGLSTPKASKLIG